MALAVALLALLALLPAVAQAATGSISGTVKDAVSEAGIEDVEVCAWAVYLEDEEAGEPFACEVTDSGGTYLLGNLSLGEYEVEFWASHLGYATQVYDHRAFWWEADPVQVEASATTTGINADLEEEATVEGTVKAASTGVGLEEVEVCAWETALEAGRCTFSKPDGSYRLGGLIAGNYGVEFFPFGPYDVQYWDHKPSWESADVLSLDAGDSVSGINGDLLGGPPAPTPAPTPSVAPPAFVAPIATAPKPKRKHCKKGFRKKRTKKGKVRCVKIKKKKHRRRHHNGTKRAARVSVR